MITTSTAPFVIEDGSEQKFDGSSIVCEPVYYENLARFDVMLLVQDSATTNQIGRGYMTLTKAEVDAEVGGGSGETDPWFNALQKAARTKLSAMTGNGSTTFLIV
jgi:hypothetical protein